MYLKKLELLGFKSFADRTELVFGPGMTAVVGPNGCGKSNVVDAFKWIFGEQSAKGMRGTEMKDVIFNGTQNRKPTGFAEVTVVFENSDRFLDVDYSEVAITRRLFRSGESEYLINKQKARLKDIRELFMGTGVGQTSYSILEQGKIDILLQASNVDRRFIFEEAAGISKYLSKKEETIRALLRVEENLTRLNDIIDEVEKRLHRVKAQASRARRYRELSERLKELRVRSTVEDFRESVTTRTAISSQLYWYNFKSNHLEKLMADVSAACETKTHERQAQAEILKSIREDIARNHVQEQRTRERIEQAECRLKDLGEEKAHKADDLEATLSNLQVLKESLEGERQELAALELDVARRKEACETIWKDLDELKRAREAIEGSLKEAKERVVAALQAGSRTANGIVALEAEISNLSGQKERLSTLADAHRAQLHEASEKDVSGQAELERIRSEREGLVAGLSRIDAEESALRAELDDMEKDLASRLEVLNQCRSRHGVLQSLEENLEGVNRSVADVLRRKESRPELSEVHGMVASLIKVEARFARAVEAALGPHAQSLLVETQDGALGLLDFARDEKMGGLEVICLDRVDPIPLEYFPRQAGVLGALREKVEVPSEISEVFDGLLANVVLVEDFPTAVALSRNGLRPFRLVTLSGEMLEPWGALSMSGESELGLISRRSEMEELLATATRLEAEAGSLRERHGLLKAELSSKLDEKERLRAALAALERRMVQVEGMLSQLAAEKDRLEREISVGLSELKGIEEEIESRSGEKQRLDAEARRLDEEKAAAEALVSSLEESLSSARSREDVLSEASTQARLALAQAEKREEGLRELLRRQEANLAERQVHVESLRDEIKAVTRRYAESQESIRASRAEALRLQGAEKEIQGSLTAAEALDRELQEREGACRRLLEGLHQECTRVQREREQVQLRDQEERHRRNTLVDRLSEEYEIDLTKLLETEEKVKALASAVPPAEGPSAEGSGPPPPAEMPFPECRYLLPDPDWNREKVREEVRELQERIRKLGGVNLEALDELGELEGRYRFQQAQRADLVESEKHLQGIIAEINKTSRELFLKTFEEVQMHFSDIFTKCFGGGKAELILEEGADVLEAGIDIVARPPGKKITRLTLMSGGEKTMTTIALLFAIFRARPSPFCILDEVDAPLDETNVRRFIVLLEDFLAQTQFIVITHNKLSMAQASTLYGITMEERGVSKRVSVELETYDPEKMQASVAGRS